MNREMLTFPIWGNTPRVRHVRAPLENGDLQGQELPPKSQIDSMRLPFLKTKGAHLQMIFRGREFMRAGSTCGYVTSLPGHSEFRQ